MFKNIVWLSFLVSGLAMAAGTAKKDTAPVKGHKPYIVVEIEHGVALGGIIGVSTARCYDVDIDSCWSPSLGIDITYQWQINRVDVPGETKKSMVLPKNVKIGDKIRVAAIGHTDSRITDPSESDVTYSADGVVLPGKFKMIINGHEFALDDGINFPETLPQGAKFELAIDGGSSSDYRFDVGLSGCANPPSISGSVYSFPTAYPDYVGCKITLSAFPKGYNGQEGKITYSFVPKKLFFHDGVSIFSNSSLNVCVGGNLVKQSDMTSQLGQTGGQHIQRGKTGKLLDEWGPLNAFGWPVSGNTSTSPKTNGWYWLDGHSAPMDGNYNTLRDRIYVENGTVYYNGPIKEFAQIACVYPKSKR